MRSNIKKRTNINFTDTDLKYIEYIKQTQPNTTTSDAIRDAVRFYAIELGYYKGNKLTIIDKNGNSEFDEWDEE